MFLSDHIFSFRITIENEKIDQSLLLVNNQQNTIAKKLEMKQILKSDDDYDSLNTSSMLKFEIDQKNDSQLQSCFGDNQMAPSKNKFTRFKRKL